MKQPSKSHKAHVSDEKKEVVKKIHDLAKRYPLVALVNMENLPTAQLQGIRKKLRGSMDLFVAKKRLIRIALKEAAKERPGIDNLNDRIQGMPGLLFAKENPFKVFKFLKDNKSKAPARGGQTAPNDITIQAGPTPFAPGPIIGELGGVGLKTGVEGGKVAIKETKVVVHEGEVISQKLADILMRLGVTPMEIGLNLVAAYEAGAIINKETLDIDPAAYLNQVRTAHGQALSLALEAGITSKDSITLLLAKAAQQARSLVMSEGIIIKGHLPEVLGGAQVRAMSLQARLGL